MNPDTTYKMKICAWGIFDILRRRFNILQIDILLSVHLFFTFHAFFICGAVTRRSWLGRQICWLVLVPRHSSFVPYAEPSTVNSEHDDATFFIITTFYSSWCFACEIFLRRFMYFVIKQFLPTAFLEFLSDQGNFHDFAAWCHHSQNYSKSHKSSFKELST